MGTGPVRENILNGPNVLTLTRIPLSAALFVCIALEAWTAGLVVFLVASVTDWLDGVWARRAGLVTVFGRNLDPLLDKVLVGGAFIFLIPVPGLDGLPVVTPWMVTVVVGRELLITGLRGYMETVGVKFGADRWGKIKMILQCVVLIAVLAALAFRPPVEAQVGIDVLMYAMLLATVLSGAKYVVKAATLLRTP
jgi:CDP-diacylglycerol--glycerol-3-phosphate 3-phosphatidyltransferase